MVCELVTPLSGKKAHAEASLLLSLDLSKNDAGGLDARGILLPTNASTSLFHKYIPLASQRLNSVWTSSKTHILKITAWLPMAPHLSSQPPIFLDPPWMETCWISLLS